jgi:hypothetical protein
MGTVMATLTCPGCGSEVEVDQGSKSSAEFCPTCDYPLFWATPPKEQQLLGGDDNAEPTLRRLPGAGGKQAIATAACPRCFELNPLDAEVCLRCGSPMVLPDPEPEPEPVLEEPEPEPEPELIPEPEHDWRPWALLAVLGAIAIVILVILLT